VISAVRDVTRLELAGDSVPALTEALAQVAPDWLASVVDVHQWTGRYGPRITSWTTSRSKAKRDALAAQYGTDGHTMLAALWSPSAPGWLRELPQADVLRQVLLQHYLVEHRADGSEVIRQREEQQAGLQPGRDRLASPHDTDARWAAKGSITWSGYKLHLTETCDDPPEPGPDEARGDHRRVEPPNLITAVHTTPATEPDTLAVDPIHAQLAERGLLPGEHYLDSGYPSVDGVVAARTEHGIEIIRSTAPRRPRPGAVTPAPTSPSTTTPAPRPARTGKRAPPGTTASSTAWRRSSSRSRTGPATAVRSAPPAQPARPADAN